MVYHLAAELLLLVHLAFVVTVVLGGLAWLKWRRAPLVHLPVAVWGVLVEATGWLCPLTTWENQLLRAAGESGYQGGFIDHYLLAVLYPDGLTRDVQWLLAAAVLILNALIYTAIWRWRARRWVRTGDDAGD